MLKYGFTSFLISETKDVRTLSNHPVHLIDVEGRVGDFLSFKKERTLYIYKITIIIPPTTLYKGNLSPTALIPFCDLNGNTSAMGVKIDQFDVPVCNSFKDKIVMGQLCYEVDPNLYINTGISENARKFDLILIIDYNEDRQLFLDDETEEKIEVQTKHPFRQNTSLEDSFIYFETLGMYK